MNPTNPSESEQSSGRDQSITSSNSTFLSEPVKVVTVNTETGCNYGSSDTSGLNITQATTSIPEDSSLVTNEEPQILSSDVRLVSGNVRLENNVENMNKLKVNTSNMTCNVKTEFQSEQQSMDNTSTTNVTILPSASNNEKKGKSRRRRKGITRVGKRGKYCEFPVWRQKLLNEMNKAKMELLKDNGCKSPGTPKRRQPTNTDAVLRELGFEMEVSSDAACSAVTSLSQGRTPRRSKLKALVSLSEIASRAQPIITDKNNSKCKDKKKNVVAEVVDFDNTALLLWCNDCREKKEGACGFHGALKHSKHGQFHVPFKPLASLPGNMALSRSTALAEKLGVFAKEGVPTRTAFGPLEGCILDIKTIPQGYGADHIWQIFDEAGKCVRLIDCQESNSSNWMCFVQAARYEGEQNLVVTQIDREIYFVTNRDVRENEELLFWYPEYYGARLGVSQNPQLLMSKACPVSACKVRFKCTDYMVRHLSLVHHEGTREHLGKTGYYCAVCAQADVRSTNKKCFHATYDKLIQHILSDKSHTPNSCDGCGRMIAPDPELMFMHADCQALIEQKLLIEREKAMEKMQRKKLVNSVASRNVNQGCDTEMNGALDQGVEMENPESQRTKKVTGTDPIIPPVENSIEPVVSETDVKKKSSESVKQKPCRFCGKMISAKNQYRHEKYIHLGKPHPRPTTKQPCGICGIYVLSIRKHERNVHLGIKKIQKACQICGKVISAQQLSRHRRIHNSGTESKSNYPCEYCGKIFNRPDNLKTHIRRHTGDMPFVCQHCGKGHTTKQWRDNHQKTCAQSPNPLPHNDIIIRPKRKPAKRHQDAMSYATYESQLATEHIEIDNHMSVSQNMEITLGSTSGVTPYYCGM